MILPIIDDRNETVYLESIALGGFFSWNDYLMRRLQEDPSNSISIFSVDCDIPCELVGSGSVISMDPKKLVEPIKCELHIVED